MIHNLVRTALKFSAIPVLCALMSGTSLAQGGFTCPDDSEYEAYDNSQGTSDKTLTVDVTGGNNHDEDFWVVVYDPAHPEQIKDKVHYTDGNEPSITVGKGYKAKIVDKDYQESDPPSWHNDTGNKAVSGSITIT